MNNINRFFIVVAILLGFSLQTKAQDVANEIKKISKSIADDQNKDLQSRRIAYFKVNAIDYLKMKMRDGMMNDSKNTKLYNDNIKMINEQSYAMYEYINLFIKKLAEAKQPEAKDAVMNSFKTTSISNPLFNDTDLELVQSYVNNEDYLTRFSLDTNWVKALEIMRKAK